jgi:outer membrane protein assembly complex protein YaeT
VRRLPLAALAALALWAAAGARAAEPGPARPTVSRVELLAPPGEDLAALRPLVALGPGDPLRARAVRRTVQALYGLGRFGNVVVTSAPDPKAPGQVVLQVRCLPRRLVATVRFRGQVPPGFPESRLARLTGLAPGADFEPARLERGLRRLEAGLSRAGWRQARARAEVRGDDRAVVTVEVQQRAATLVSRLALAGVGGAEARELSAGLRTRPGAPLDMDALEEDGRTVLQRLRAAGRLRARVGSARLHLTADEQGPRAEVELPVEPGPRLSFRFPGASAFEPAELRARLGLDPEEPLDASSLAAAAARLQAFYQSQGNLFARVEGQEVVEGGAHALVFRIEEGRRYRVGEVRFAGAAFHDQRWLRARLLEGLEEEAPDEAERQDLSRERLELAAGTRVAGEARAPAAPGEAYDEQAWERALSRLVDLYRGEGFLDATLEGVRVDADARRGVVDVLVRLMEGARTTVESIAFEGNAAVALPELARTARLAPGAPLSGEEVAQTRDGILALYAHQGFAYARVEALEELSPDHRTAVVRFRIAEGPRVRIANVVVSGNRHTREDVVRGALALKPGDVYDPEALSRSQTSLLRLGAFRSVGLRLGDPEVPEEKKDLAVELSERPWATLAPGAGFSLADGPRAFLEWNQPNLFGRALDFTARGKVNYPLPEFRQNLSTDPAQRVEGRADVALHYPRVHFLPFTAGARFDAIVERLHRSAYDLTRGSFVPGIDVPLGDRITLSLSYELEVDHMIRRGTSEALTRADLERLRLPEGITTLQSFRPTLTLDYRDNAVHPRHGWFATGTADLAHSIASALLFGVVPGSDPANFTSMLKLSGGLTGYLPVGSQSAFALSVRAGRVVALEGGSRTIGPKRFFLGGAATMRGYAEDEMLPADYRALVSGQVGACRAAGGQGCTQAASAVLAGQQLTSEGGEAFALVKAELRLPLSRSTELGLFTDLGNLWLDPTNADYLDLRLNVGAGLRLLTPIGPAAIDVGFNVSPDRLFGERVIAPHFSIGLF